MKKKQLKPKEAMQHFSDVQEVNGTKLLSKRSNDIVQEAKGVKAKYNLDCPVHYPSWLSTKLFEFLSVTLKVVRRGQHGKQKCLLANPHDKSVLYITPTKPVTPTKC